MYEDDEGIKGVEFPAGNRRIDILAVDDKKRLVVIELKVSRGYDRTVGQLLGYMARIKKELAEPNQDIRRQWDCPPDRKSRERDGSAGWPDSMLQATRRPAKIIVVDQTVPFVTRPELQRAEPVPQTDVREVRQS